MRIIISTPFYKPAQGFGGPVEGIRSFVNAVRASGIALSVLSTDADAIQERCIPTPGWKVNDGVMTYYARCWGGSRHSTAGSFFLAPSLVTEFMKELPKCDLVHIHGTWVFPTLVGSRVAMLLDKPYLMSLHGCLFPWAMGHKYFKKRIYLKLFESATILRAARVHFATDLERRSLESIFPLVKGVVVPNPVESCPIDFCERSVFKKNLGFDEKVILVAFLGRIHLVKGLDLLINTASITVKEVPNVRFALFGPDDGYASVLREFILREGLEKFVFLFGSVSGDSKWKSLLAADVFVLPSHQENFGIAAAEAMACGVPIVTSSAVGIADDIKRFGAGLVVERTPDGFAGGLITLLRDADLRIRMGNAGRQLVKNKYSPKIVAQAMIKIYEEVLREHSRKPISWPRKATEYMTSLWRK